MSKDIEPLLPCPFCGEVPVARKEIRSVRNENTMYLFEIEHTCNGFRHSHASLFFQNEDTEEKCRETLDDSERLYSSLWNVRNPEKTG